MAGKCIFFDIDGTLVSEQTHQIPQSALDALQAVRDKGNYIFLNTGRPYSTITPMLMELKFDGYCCGCGTEIVVNGQMLYREELPQKVCQEIVEKMRACRIDAILENSPLCWTILNQKFGVLEKALTALNGEKFDNIIPWQDGVSTFTKFCLGYGPGSQLEEFKDYLDEKNLEYIDRFEGFGEIVPKHCSKATAIHRICEHYHVSIEDCYAFGDSTNDLPMLLAVKHSVMMGNGNPALFDLVEKVTDRLENDGVAKALKEYQLI